MSVPQPYLIAPTTEYEARYGKPVLLTDCEIGHLLDVLTDAADPGTPDGNAARDALWQKLLASWNTVAPYERELVVTQAERVCEEVARLARRV